MSIKSPSKIAWWHPIDRTSPSIPPTATGRRRERTRGLDRPASPVPSHRKRRVGRRVLCPRGRAAQGPPGM